MKKQRFTFFPAVHAFFVRNDEVLLLERTNTGYMDGFFSLPAGHVDGNETIAEAMIREVREEVGIHLSSLSNPVHVMHRIVSKEEERIDFFYLIENWDGELQNMEPEKCAQIVWVKQNKLPENMVPYIRQAWAEVQQKHTFSERREKN